MDDILIDESISNYLKFEDQDLSQIEQSDLSLFSKFKIESLKSESFYEDSKLVDESINILNQSAGVNAYIANEKWASSQNIQGKITSINSEEVSVDCLVDVENRDFQHRIFPRSLFENIESLNAETYVLLKIKSKPGAFRIDVILGNGIVDKKLFNLKENWDSLAKENLDQRLTKW